MVGVYVQWIFTKDRVRCMKFKKQSFNRLREIHGGMHERKLQTKRKRIIKKSRRIITRIKNSCHGKRCFIVGNGPSLTVHDLEMLRNEITFASNRIYHIFSQTTWRPTYYCIQDYMLIKKSFNEINQVQAKKRFVGYYDDEEFDLLKNFTFIYLHLDSFYPNLPKFSENLNNGIYEGFTVTYMCLQLALFMGFKEIVLLGIDHNYSVELLPDGKIKTNSVEKDHFDSKDKVDNLPQPAKSTLAYEATKQYCEKNGINVYNATRGGLLEVFERKSLEDILQ